MTFITYTGYAVVYRSGMGEVDHYADLSHEQIWENIGVTVGGIERYIPDELAVPFGRLYFRAENHLHSLGSGWRSRFFSYAPSINCSNGAVECLPVLSRTVGGVQDAYAIVNTMDSQAVWYYPPGSEIPVTDNPAAEREMLDELQYLLFMMVHNPDTCAVNGRLLAPPPASA